MLSHDSAHPEKDTFGFVCTRGPEPGEEGDNGRVFFNAGGGGLIKKLVLTTLMLRYREGDYGEK